MTLAPTRVSVLCWKAWIALCIKAESCSGRRRAPVRMQFGNCSDRLPPRQHQTDGFSDQLRTHGGRTSGNKLFVVRRRPGSINRCARALSDRDACVRLSRHALSGAASGPSGKSALLNSVWAILRSAASAKASNAYRCQEVAPFRCRQEFCDSPARCT